MIYTQQQAKQMHEALEAINGYSLLCSGECELGCEVLEDIPYIRDLLKQLESKDDE
jgi:hypothetical protein